MFSIVQQFVLFTYWVHTSVAAFYTNGSEMFSHSLLLLFVAILSMDADEKLLDEGESLEGFDCKSRKDLSQMGNDVLVTVGSISQDEQRKSTSSKRQEDWKGNLGQKSTEVNSTPGEVDGCEIDHKTIDSVLARGERLDSLVEKSSIECFASQYT
ncbi:hypothetical protein Fmac_027642 [Flemingia macrophylla]|uniref:Uncharacterized protein n=1 Tax=Flemingia macrophylla TaxID=520843 RepID=A0ABD1LIA8_9FABA